MEKVNEIYENPNICGFSPQEIRYIKTEKEFIDAFGLPGVFVMETDINYAPPTPMSTDDLKDKLIADLDQERHDMIDVMKEKEKRASDMENVLKQVWLNLCDTYDKTSSIKEISRPTLFFIYNQLETYVTNCSYYANRDLTKKIKKEIEKTEIKTT